MELRTYCRACETLRTFKASEVCRAFRSWTIDEIQRSGALGCGACRQLTSVVVMGEYWCHPTSVEAWPVDGAAWTMARCDGLSG